MQGLSDDELDNIFRNSMNSTPPFDPEAWNAMEKKLDSEKRRRAFYYRIIGISSLLLLIGLSVVLRNYLLNTRTTTTANTVQQNKTAEKDNSNVQNNSSLVPNDGSGDSSTQSPKVSSKNKVKSSTALYRSGKGSSGSNNYFAKQGVVKKSNTSVKSSNTDAKPEKKESGNSDEDNYVTNATSTENHTPHTAANTNDLVNVVPMDEKNNATGSKGNVDLNSRLSTSDEGALELQNKQEHIVSSSSLAPAQDTNTVAAKSEAGKEISNSISSETIAGSDAPKQTQNNAEVIAQSNTIKKDTLTNKPVAATAIASKDSIAKAQNYRQRWSINLLMNPEYSGTKEFDFYKLGFNVGLLGEYYLSPRFSLVAGAIYAKKIYSADGYDYTPAHNYWPKHAVPTTVHATCGIIEIPVNIRYKFVKKQSYALFVSTGLSSYLMLKENYNYQYAVNTPGELTSTQVVNKNRYFFSIYNLSVGIEKYINNNWSVQAEPYIQLPFSGVGEGKIKLISTGMYFSVKYYIR